MLPQQGGRSLAMTEEPSLSLVWSLLLSGGPMVLCREELGTHLDFAGIFLLFLRVLLRGIDPIKEGFSLEVVASVPRLGGDRSLQCSGSMGGEQGGEGSRGVLPSLAPHVFSPPEAIGRSKTCWHRIREKGLVQGSAFASQMLSLEIQ